MYYVTTTKKYMAGMKCVGESSSVCVYQCMHSLHVIIDLCDVPTRLRFVSVFATQLACLLLLRVLRKYSAPSSELASQLPGQNASFLSDDLQVCRVWAIT